MTTYRKRNGNDAGDSAVTQNPPKPISATKASSLVSKAEAAGSAGTHQDDLSSTVSKREKIAMLAYTYWVQRGCQGGSPEEDWFRAELELSSAPPNSLAGN